MELGAEKETARVPPSLDSPLSAAPETFLWRDAGSAFPIAFGPQLQPLPGARCRVSAARVRWPWRSFWNRALRLPDRAGRPALSPTSDSQFRLPSLRHLLHPSACPADLPRETKSLARLGQAACSKPPSRPRPRPPRESPTRARPPQSSRTAPAPVSPSPQRSSAAPGPAPAPVRPGPSSVPDQRSASARWLPSARRLPALRPRTFRPALRATIRAPHPTSPACVARPFFLATRHSLAPSPVEGPLATS